jgi:transcriptional regulator GlxA family with amidase domain
MLNSLNGIGFGIQHLPSYLRRDELVPHTHDVVEMNYVLRGQGIHRLGDHDYPSGPGSLGIVHYTQPHDILTGPVPMAVINLYLDLQRFVVPDLGEELSGALYAILPMHPSLRHRRNHFIHVQFPPGGSQEALLWSILAEQEQAAQGYREAMRSLLRLFLIATARQSLRQGDIGQAPEILESEAKIEALRRALDAEPEKPVVIASLAKGLGWITPHFCRAFRRHTGMSVIAYMQRQRINAAMVRLRTTRESVLAVALASGFNDPSFFTRTFRVLVGTTPSAYRQSLVGDVVGHDAGLSRPPRLNRR